MDLEIPLYESKSNNKESLYDFKGLVYNLENGSKIETKVDKSSKFKSKENKYYTINKYAFPNVKDGSIIEYRYQVSSPFFYEIPTIYIDLDVPTIYSEYVLDSPTYIAYNVDYTGSAIPKYREVDTRLLYGENYRTYRFGYENLKGFKSENFVKNSDNYRTKIRAELNSTLINNVTKNYSSSWEDIRKQLDLEEDFGYELKKQRLTRDFIPPAVASTDNVLAKADLIFNTVKNNFSWNGRNGYHTENGFRDLISTKTGNDADLNLFLVAMLREAGLDANPVLISTVENGLVNMSFPNVANFNYVIACLIINNKFYTYDATAKQSLVNMLPRRDWNDYGLLLTKDKATLLQIVNTTMSNNYLTINAKIENDGNITGTYTDKDTGMFSMTAKESYDENSDKYKKQYKDSFSVDFTDIDSKVLENGDFESTMKFNSNNLMDVVGKKIIINPILFLSKTKNEFDQSEERQYQIDFSTPFTKIKTVTLEIPQGYSIESLPKNKKIATDDKEISYTYLAEQNGNSIKVTSSVQVQSPDYPKEYYPAFKQVWKTIVDAENQVISLIKK